MYYHISSSFIFCYVIAGLLSYILVCYLVVHRIMNPKETSEKVPDQARTERCQSVFRSSAFASLAHDVEIC